MGVWIFGFEDGMGWIFWFERRKVFGFRGRLVWWGFYYFIVGVLLLGIIKESVRKV